MARNFVNGTVGGGSRGYFYDHHRSHKIRSEDHSRQNPKPSGETAKRVITIRGEQGGGFDDDHIIN